MFDRLVTRTRWLIIFRQRLLTTRGTLSSIVQCQTGIVRPKTLFVRQPLNSSVLLCMKYLYSLVLHFYWRKGVADSRCGAL